MNSLNKPSDDDAETHKNDAINTPTLDFPSDQSVDDPQDKREGLSSSTERNRKQSDLKHKIIDLKEIIDFKEFILNYLTPIMMVFFIFFTILVLVNCYIRNINFVEKRKNVDLENMEDFFKKLNAEYSAYDVRWNYVMKAAVRTVLTQEEPKRPGVITLINFHPDKGLIGRLANHLAQNVSSLVNDRPVVHLDGKDYTLNDPVYVKHALEDSITRGIHRGNPVVLVENLQEIPAESILLFHGLCDDVNAPYKNITYIFTIQHFKKTSINSIDFSGIDIEVTHPWKKSLNVEKRSALESRIGTNKVLIFQKVQW